MRVYGQWAGNPKGVPEDPNCCVEEVYTFHMSHQCSRPRGYGPNKEYCKVHAHNHVENIIPVYKYYAEYWFDKYTITKTAVYSETDTYVYLDHGRRCAKWDVDHLYADTWKEAQEFLLQLAQKRKDQLERQLESLQCIIKDIVEMKEE